MYEVVMNLYDGNGELMSQTKYAKQYVKRGNAENALKEWRKEMLAVPYFANAEFKIIGNEGFMVVTEIHNKGGIERWYYGTFEDEDRANEVAYNLGGEYPTFHIVIPAEEAKEWGVQNLPN